MVLCPLNVTLGKAGTIPEHQPSTLPAAGHGSGTRPCRSSRVDAGDLEMFGRVLKALYTRHHQEYMSLRGILAQKGTYLVDFLLTRSDGQTVRGRDVLMVVPACFVHVLNSARTSLATLPSVRISVVAV